jgi:xanthine dehydrogenase YagR molybdenum-binding subunit
MTAASTGSAVFEACTKLRKQLTDQGVTDNASLVALLGRQPGRTLTVTVDSNPAAPMGGGPRSSHAFGAVFVEAWIDRELGEIRIPRVVAAYAAGKILNPKTARSQLQGGIVWGIGMALEEETLVDPHTGRYINADLAEYHVPVHADIGQLDVTFVDEVDPYVNPIGVKGVGEIGITGVAAAVANAVYHATGVRVRDLPITLDKLIGGTRV